jgi:methyl-accepting chemotaxis protein
MAKRLDVLKKERPRAQGNPLQDGIGSDLACHLSSIEAGLMAVSSNAEPDFMALGERLQQGYGLVADLTRDTIEIAGLIKGDSNGNTLEQIETSVNQSIGMLKKCRDNAVSKSNPVKAVQDHLEQLNSKRGEIETIARYLRAVALNIFIESSRSEISDENFSVIAREIKQLSEKILQVSKKIHDFTLASKALFSSMYGEIESGIAKMTSLADLAEQSAGNSIEKTEHLMCFSLGMVEDAGAMSSGISQEVEKVVMGVQLHDSMRQRIEHIVSGLKDVESLCTQGAACVDQGNTDDFTTAHAIIVLQLAQIEQIISEIDGVYQQTRIAFGNITDDISSMAQNISEIADPHTRPGHGRQRGDDPFSLLSSDLANIRSLESQGSDLENRLVVIYEKAFETASTLSSLAGELHHISQESQNKALNAMIAANRLGDGGKTLAVLGREMRALSTQAEDSIAGVKEIIASIVSAIEWVELEKTFESGSGSSSDQPENALDTILAAVLGLYEQTGERVRGLGDVSEALIFAVSEAKNGLQFFPLLSESLTSQMDQLTGVKDLLSPLIDEKASAQIADAYMAERYTMEKERAVHKESVAGISGNSRLGEPTGGVELFDDDAPDEIFGTDELGDNIELF